MKYYFSYIRVSTVRQGQNGTSLAEQREAIKRYADRWSLNINKEFEERETAAKRGRPIFMQMLKALKQGGAQGVIIHKIDRSARNLKDWADLGELMDQGIEIHFANESLDLHSRGGRLSADIQAVVAADYIRNLREETRKGFYGRIKQGLCPLPAPVGYLDQGKGKTKEPDPVQAPLVKKAFEFYATGKWGLNALVEKMYEVGLRNRRGNKVTRNGMSHLLHNPFYIGLIKIRVRGELFPGKHAPIISKSLFDQVQSVLSGKNIEKSHRHFFLFRKLTHCSSCGSTLIGETQKGHNYYRCHTKGCAQKSIREDPLEIALIEVLKQLRFNEVENRYIREQIKESYQNVITFKETQTRALNLQLEQLQARLSKIADAYIDAMLDKTTYLEKKNSLILEQEAMKESLKKLDAGGQEVLKRVEAFIELLNNAYLSYKLANQEERRDLIKMIISNLTVEGKNLTIKLNYPFQIVADRQKSTNGSPQRISYRTISAILGQLCDYFKEHQLFLESGEERAGKIKLSSDRAMLVGVRKITNQSFRLSPNPLSDEII
jgi:DNA invertase Pin-like site-specific DNA recombinase